MPFIDTKYQTDAGTIVNIRISTNTAAAEGNDAPTAAITDEALWAFASNPGSRRKRQLNARGVIVGRTIGVAPNSFVRKTFVPILSPTVYADTEKGDTVTLGTTAYTVRSKVPQA